MSTAEEFQQYLRESLEAAANATTEAERKAFLQMAQTWSEAAGVAGLSVAAPIEPKSDSCARD